MKRSEPNRTPSDVTEMVSAAVELAEIALRRYNVRLSYLIHPGLPKLPVDPILIEQVLVNLLKNAAEAIAQAQRPLPERRVDLQVASSRFEGRPVVDFVVTDTGRGIPPEVMARCIQEADEPPDRGRFAPPAPSGFAWAPLRCSASFHLLPVEA